ncbi:MAG: hypothetical protein ACKV2O_00755 [Acidimicrobiales bacterium]
MTDCGDQVLNGVRTADKYRVGVWVQQSSGALFFRGHFPGVVQTDAGLPWIVIRVPVGGYVEEMWVRATDRSKPAQRLRVWTDHQSLDAKPSYVTDTIYLRTPPEPRLSPVIYAYEGAEHCWACLVDG